MIEQSVEVSNKDVKIIGVVYANVGAEYAKNVYNSIGYGRITSKVIVLGRKQL